jgi:hypothetical protein
MEVCLNIRIVAGEIGVTASAIFLVAYGIYKAWQDFSGKLFSGYPRNFK